MAFITRDPAWRWCAAVAAALLLVSGCADKAARPKHEALIENEQVPGRKTTIKFAFWGSPETELVQFANIARAFVKARPRIRVRLIVLPWGQYWTKLRTQAAGNIAPDVVRLYSGAAGAWFDREILLDLGPLAPRDGVNLGDYFKVAMDACTWKGKLYSLPSDVPVRVLMYNKDLFDKAGLSGRYPSDKKPLTWEELVALAERLTIERNGRIVQYGLALGPQADMILIHQAGGRLVDRPVAPTRCTANTPEVTRGLRFYYDLQFTHKVAPDVSKQQKSGFGEMEFPLLSRRVAMGFAGPWTFKRYAQSGMRLGLAPMFTGPKRAQICTPNSNGVYAGSLHPEEAWAFVRFLSGPEGQRLVARQGMGVPALRALARSTDFYENEYGFRNLHVYCDDLEYAQPMIMSPTEELLQVFDKVMGDMRREPDVTPAVAAREIETAMNRVFERLKPRRASLASRAIWPILIGVSLLLGIGGVVLASRRSAVLRAATAGRPSNLAGYLFISPWIFGLICFNLGPILTAVVLSFTSWDLIRSPTWVGVANFKEIFAVDETFRHSLGVTAIYVVCSVPILVLGGLASAMLLARARRLSGVFRTILYLPSMFSGVAMTLLWMWMYNPKVGVINYLLSLVGVAGPDWLDGKVQSAVGGAIFGYWVLPALIFMNALWIGGNMIIFSAALQGIPRSLYDAAAVDGAGAWSRFRHVTLPMLSPAILFTTVVGTITSFQAFTQAFMIRGSRGDLGGPGDASMLYVLYTYIKAFMHYRMGYACALALILFAVIFALTFLQIRLSRRWVFYQAERV